MTTLRELVEDLSRRTEEFFNRHGCIQPYWIFVNRSGAMAYAPTPDTDKDTAAILMRALFAIEGATRCVFIDEAWTVHASGTDAAEAVTAAANRGSLEHYPGREEVVMFAAEDATEGVLTGQRAIIREPGKKPRLGPLRIDDDWTASEGRMVGMLPRPAGARMQ